MKEKKRKTYRRGRGVAGGLGDDRGGVRGRRTQSHRVGGNFGRRDFRRAGHGTTTTSSRRLRGRGRGRDQGHGAGRGGGRDNPDGGIADGRRRVVVPGMELMVTVQRVVVRGLTNDREGSGQEADGQFGEELHIEQIK